MFDSLGCCFKEKKKVHIEEQVAVESKGEKEQLSREDYYDFLAPSVYHLQTAFMEQLNQAGLEESATIYDIENLQSVEPGLIRQKGVNITCPIDGKPGAAYVHCLQDEYDDHGDTTCTSEDHVGTATHMLSYAWGYKYGDIVDTLVQYCENNSLSTKRTYVWICAFCNNQHRVVDRNVPFEDFKHIFNNRVKGIGNILAMMTPWNDPAYLKRVWCIFEMYSAYADDDINIEIIMPPAQKTSLMNAVLKPTDATGVSGLDELFAALASTKVESAQASKMEDKENILKLVREQEGGCPQFNADINHLLRKWIRDTVMNEVDRTEAEYENSINNDNTSGYSRQESGTFLTFAASFFSRVGAHNEAKELHEKGLAIYKTLDDNENTKELMARCYNNIGTECESLGRYDEALENHSKCREAFEEIYGNEHENTSVSYFNIGAVLRKLERNDEALEMYMKSLNIDKKIKGDQHIDVALSYSYIGRLKQHDEKWDEAKEMFEKSLEIRLATYGMNHPDAGVGYGDLGLLHHMQGEYDEAVEYHKKALIIQEQILGNMHPDTASIYQNLGGAYYEKGMYAEALELHKKAKLAYETTFGEDHPKSVVSRQWIDIVEQEVINAGTNGNGND